MTNNNVPAVRNGGDVALAGEARDDNVASALETLLANLSHRAEAFSDVSLTYHVDRGADGSSRSCFSYRCCKR